MHSATPDFFMEVLSDRIASRCTTSSQRPHLQPVYWCLKPVLVSIEAKAATAQVF
ncbi:MAG: hypothetical protein HC781_20050 [Leptolyngbyaceae cyanobacterium CSU_1_4]|nr:hypothetical protein [Leptolyngbyaceae cyanobacterium CSU_1_4]